MKISSTTQERMSRRHVSFGLSVTHFNASSREVFLSFFRPHRRLLFSRVQFHCGVCPRERSASARFILIGKLNILLFLFAAFLLHSHFISHFAPSIHPLNVILLPQHRTISRSFSPLLSLTLSLFSRPLRKKQPLIYFI